MTDDSQPRGSEEPVFDGDKAVERWQALLKRWAELDRGQG